MRGSFPRAPEAGMYVACYRRGKVLAPTMEGYVSAGTGQGVEGFFLVMGDIGAGMPVKCANVDVEGVGDVAAVFIAAVTAVGR